MIEMRRKASENRKIFLFVENIYYVNLLNYNIVDDKKRVVQSSENRILWAKWALVRVCIGAPRFLPAQNYKKYIKFTWIELEISIILRSIQTWSHTTWILKLISAQLMYNNIGKYIIIYFISCDMVQEWWNVLYKKYFKR